MGRRAGTWIGAWLWVAVAAGNAAAQSSPCGGLDSGENAELEVTPADRAEGVARNAAILVRHPAGTDLPALVRELAAGAGDECSREPVCLFRDAREPGGLAREAVPGDVQQIDARTLAFVPRARLEPDSDYFPLVTRTGFDRAARTELEFRTGTSIDRDPPTFDAGDEQLRLSIDAPPAECDAPEGSVRVQIGVPHARDDGDDESVELLLFVTSAQDARGPTLRARSRNRGEGEVVLTFLLSAEEAEQPACVALRAIDGLGRSSSGEPSLCFEPRQGSQFAPLCSAGREPGRADGSAGTLVLSTLWLVVALRRRRRDCQGSTEPTGTRQ